MNYNLTIVLSLALICIALLLLEAEAGETDENRVEFIGRYIETDDPYEDTFMVLLERPNGIVVQLLNLPDEEELPGLESGVSELSVLGILNDDETKLDVLEATLMEKEKDSFASFASSSDDTKGDGKYTGDRTVLVVRVKAQDERASSSKELWCQSLLVTQRQCNGSP
jgi:hypothetical protein